MKAWFEQWRRLEGAFGLSIAKRILTRSRIRLSGGSAGAKKKNSRPTEEPAVEAGEAIPFP